jgi:hypothetical protein
MLSGRSILSALHILSGRSTVRVHSKVPVSSMLQVLNTLPVVQVPVVRHNRIPVVVGLQGSLRFR